MTILIALCNFLKCTYCLDQLKKRLPMYQEVDSNSFYVKAAIFRGDEISNIISEAHQIKLVGLSLR